VAVGHGCIELPCEYTAGSQRWAVDIGGGGFEAASGLYRITWTAGYISHPLGIGADERILWRRPAIHGWRFWWHALTEDHGKRLYRVANYNLVLQAPAEMPDALNLLEALAASYSTRIELSTCEHPLHEKP
jgi:hypothetical protein